MRRITDKEKEEIIEKRKGGATVMALAVEYDTSISTVARIINPEYAESVRKQQKERYHREKEEKEQMKKELEALKAGQEELEALRGTREEE